MRNRYPGTCYQCGEKVLPNQGHFERYKGAWRVQHATCCLKAREEKEINQEKFKMTTETKVKHTPEPWYLVANNVEPLIYICRQWDERVKPGEHDTFGSYLGGHIAHIEFTRNGIPSQEQAEANARRIVACVNACEGISTEAIEAGIVKAERQTIEAVQDILRPYLIPGNNINPEDIINDILGVVDHVKLVELQRMARGES